MTMELKAINKPMRENEELKAQLPPKPKALLRIRGKDYRLVWRSILFPPRGKIGTTYLL